MFGSSGRVVRPKVWALLGSTAIIAIVASGCGSSSTTTTSSTNGAAAATTAAGAAGATTAAGAAAPSSSVAIQHSPTAGASPAGGTASADAMPAGAYLTKAEYEKQMHSREGTKVVLFFAAPWCPSCKATNASLESAGVPRGLTVVKVDYDTETDLKKKYGVTHQHTFVQIDASGKELAKWSGSESGEAIKAHTV